MPFQPAIDIATTTLQGLVDNQLTILDLNWFASAGITAFNLGTLANGVSTWFTNSLAPLLSEQWSAVNVHAVDNTSATGPVADSSSVQAGGVTGEAAPNNVAAVVSLRTDQRGRSGRGRNFVPGIPNSLITLNTLDSGFITNLVTAYQLLVGAGSFLAGWQLVVLSRQTGGVLRANGLGIPVTSVTMVTNKVKSMRSREVGHGA